MLRSGRPSDNAVLLAELEKLRSDKTGVTCPARDADDDHNIKEASREKRHNRNNEKERWNGHHNFNEAHPDKVDFAAEIAQDRADENADYA